jgi:diphthine synthase
MTLTLISIGLTDEDDLSLRALQEARSCDALYAELYTMILDTDTERLTKAIGKPVKRLTRSQMEENSDALLEDAKQKKVGILVGGDALTATTHLPLLLDAAKKGIKTTVIHGSSILTAIAETGLSLYKFGRTVTLPLPEKAPPDTVLRTLTENREHGLHTLILLDLDAQKRQAHTIPEAIQILLEAENPEAYNRDTLTIGAARLGWNDQTIKANTAGSLSNHDFGEPPHALVVPGRLHFLEAEALKTIADCPSEVLESHKPIGTLERLIDKYSAGCRRAIDNLETREPPKAITPDEVKTLIEHAERYLNDADHYTGERKPTALASVSYAEGILDALRLLGLVDFKW